MDAAEGLAAVAPTKAAITALYRRHRTGVRAVCLRMTGNAAVADDLAQEVFVRALRAAGEFRGEAAPGTWLYAIARNLSVDHLRREAYGAARLAEATAEREVLRDAAQARLVGGGATDPRRQVLHEGLGRLSIEDREVVVLARFVGLGSEALAEVLECSPGAARVRLHRALARLRRECLKIAERHDEL